MSKISFSRKFAMMGFALMGVGLALGVTGGNRASAIGVGELQECTISKNMDGASLPSAQYTTSVNSAEGDGVPFTYMRYKLER